MRHRYDLIHLHEFQIEETQSRNNVLTADATIIPSILCEFLLSSRVFRIVHTVIPPKRTCDFDPHIYPYCHYYQHNWEKNSIDSDQTGIQRRCTIEVGFMTPRWLLRWQIIWQPRNVHLSLIPR